ncbi:MAG: shikimate kinase [Spirochaetaceae bacterium]|nr:shikimate kinase [Spirochaetaceae bacterium]
MCGPKHCGKTAAGAALSGCSFIDLDVEIESVSGRTARELYEEGVDIFRAAETAALRQALSAASGTVLVIAAGGGITDNTPAMALLKESRAALVFLRVSAKTAWERIRARPLPPFLRTKNPEETHRLLHERRNANCKKAAAYTIEAEGKTPVQIAAEIAALFEKR